MKTSNYLIIVPDNHFILNEEIFFEETDIIYLGILLSKLGHKSIFIKESYFVNVVNGNRKLDYYSKDILFLKIKDNKNKFSYLDISNYLVIQNIDCLIISNLESFFRKFNLLENQVSSNFLKIKISNIFFNNNINSPTLSISIAGVIHKKELLKNTEYSHQEFYNTVFNSIYFCDYLFFENSRQLNYLNDLINVIWRYEIKYKSYLIPFSSNILNFQKNIELNKILSKRIKVIFETSNLDKDYKNKFIVKFLDYCLEKKCSNIIIALSEKDLSNLMISLNNNFRYNELICNDIKNISSNHNILKLKENQLNIYGNFDYNLDLCPDNLHSYLSIPEYPKLHNIVSKTVLPKYIIPPNINEIYSSFIWTDICNSNFDFDNFLKFENLLANHINDKVNKNSLSANQLFLSELNRFNENLKTNTINKVYGFIETIRNFDQENFTLNNNDLLYIFENEHTAEIILGLNLANLIKKLKTKSDISLGLNIRYENLSDNSEESIFTNKILLNEFDEKSYKENKLFLYINPILDIELKRKVSLLFFIEDEKMNQLANFEVNTTFLHKSNSIKKTNLFKLRYSFISIPLKFKDNHNKINLPLYEYVFKKELPFKIKSDGALFDLHNNIDYEGKNISKRERFIYKIIHKIPFRKRLRKVNFILKTYKILKKLYKII